MQIFRYFFRDCVTNATQYSDERLGSSRRTVVKKSTIASTLVALVFIHAIVELSEIFLYVCAKLVNETVRSVLNVSVYEVWVRLYTFCELIL